MKWTKITSDGKGGFNLFDNWTGGDEVAYRIWPFLLLLPITILFGVFYPVIIWLISPFESYRSNKNNNYTSIGASIIFLLDYILGGPVWCFVIQGGNGHVLEFVATLHVGFLLINLGLAYVFSKNVSFNFLYLCGVIFMVCYMANPVLQTIAEAIMSDTPISFIADYHNEYMLNLDSNK